MKFVYPAVFYKEPNGAYSVDFPDLPGCVTCGDSLTDAFYMAEDAAAGWISTSIEDGEEIPKPSKLDEVCFDPEFGTEGFINYVFLDLNAWKLVWDSQNA